ncbi:MAG: hypothetical protein V2I66_12925, partial [Halieaceae bacterium]|nr:hypothetical protein [Halieaceae bacterium]
MPGSTPHIRITQNEGCIAVDQHRPNVTGVLGGLSLDEAVLRIPLLLPICGHAQGIAAQRAAAAARGESEPHAREHSDQLWHEQAIAAAWRLTIDWPGALDRERDIALFKAVQNADDTGSLANRLLACVPGLDSVETQEDLARWLSESDCTPASVVRRARELEANLGASPEAQLAAGETLQSLAQSALDATDFNPLEPAGAGIEVGPLAMQRHPMIVELT